MLVELKVARSIYALTISFIHYPFGTFKFQHNKLSKLMPWDDDLLQPVKRYIFDPVSNSSVYGILSSLKDYANCKKKLYSVVVMHGVYLSGMEPRFHNNFSERLIVMGCNTKNEFEKLHDERKNQKEMFCIGPYIKYAKPYWNKDFHDDLKKKFGKTLVVFLPHGNSTSSGLHQLSGLLYSPERVIDCLNHYKTTFNTIVVVDWARTTSISNKRLYESNDFVFVVSGDPNDYNFLSRQRSIIELADHSLSFTVSTHVGYFIALGKSHEIINLFGSKKPDPSNLNGYLWNRTENLTPSNEYFKSTMETYSKMSSYHKSEGGTKIKNPYCLVYSFDAEEEKILNVFFNAGDKMLREQIQVTEKHFGYTQMKTPKEIYSILK